MGQKTGVTTLVPDGRRLPDKYVSFLPNEPRLASDQPDGDDIYPHSRYDPGCIFLFGYGAMAALELTVFLNIFGTKNVPNQLKAPNGGNYFGYGDPWMQRLYANGTLDMSSVTSFSEGLANAMTASIRGHGDSAHSNPYRRYCA